MWVFAERGKENGRRFHRYRMIQEDVSGFLLDVLSDVQEKGYAYGPVNGSENFFQVTGDDGTTDYVVCAYEAREFDIEPFIMSEFYHRNGSNYVEVLKDATSDTVVTYIYTAGVPEANVEISRGVASFQQAVPDIPGDLRKEKEIISLFYHYRGTFYIEVLRDMVHDVVVVYVYPSDTPGGKMEVGRMKAGPDSGSDDMIISGMMLEIEEKIAEGRKVNGR